MRKSTATIIGIGLTAGLALSTAGSATADPTAYRPANDSRIVTGQPPFPVPTGKRLRGLPSPRKAPARVELFASWVPQTSCDPVERKGVTGFRRLVLLRFPGGANWGTTRACSTGGSSEHYDGRAWDWGINARDPAQLATAGRLLTWLTAVGRDGQAGYNARRLGIMYVIFNGRIWSQYRADEGWRVYSGSSPHADHVHFSFTWNGARKRTTFWRGKVFAEDFGPCRLAAGQAGPSLPFAPAWSGPNPNPCSR